LTDKLTAPIELLKYIVEETFRRYEGEEGFRVTQVDMYTMVDAESIERVWFDCEDFGDEIASEIRYGEVETGLEAPYNRHYEAREVGIQITDGRWIGWTHWYGGGKHGDPESIDWQPYAYFLECTEKLVKVKTWKAVD